MSKRWFAYGQAIEDIRVKKLYQEGSNWQLYETDDGVALFVLDSLHSKWVQEDWLGDRLFKQVMVQGQKYFVLTSGETWIVSMIGQSTSWITKEVTESFFRSLKQARQNHPGAILKDALFIEGYGLLLPTYTSKEDLTDDVILGKWVSAGVEISISESKTIARLNSALSEEDVKEIASALEPTKDTTGEEPVQLKEKFLLPGRPQLETFFNEHIVDIIRNPEQYARMGIHFPGAVVLYGPPGCGKTFAVEKLVEFLNWPCYTISSGSIGSPFIHETSKKIAEVFQKAMDNAPSAVIIDEMESYLTDRASTSAGQTYRVEEIAEFLRLIPEATKKRVLVFGMTNFIDQIDPAILRRGRFDHLVEVGYPSKEEILQLLNSLLDKIPVSADIDLESIADNLQGRALSDATFVAKEAGRIAAKNKSNVIRGKDFEEAIESLPVKETEKRNPIGFIWS